MRNSRVRALARVLVVFATPFITSQAALSQSCRAKSGEYVPPVVELYTSEGCNSCPPADQWLSRFKSDPGVIAMAFHVDYWDRLGWQDRFAKSAYSARQSQEQLRNGASFNYTPQIVLNGRDHKRWHRDVLPTSKSGRQQSFVDVTIVRNDEQVTATVTPRNDSYKRLSAYWTVTEDNHVSFVKAGENDGATLRHDFVVRKYALAEEWSSVAGVSRTLQFSVGTSQPQHRRSINLVVVDANSGRPVQAAALRC